MILCKKVQVQYLKHPAQSYEFSKSFVFVGQKATPYSTVNIKYFLIGKRESWNYLCVLEVLLG